MFGLFPIECGWSKFSTFSNRALSVISWENRKFRLFWSKTSIRLFYLSHNLLTTFSQILYFTKQQGVRFSYSSVQSFCKFLYYCSLLDIGAKLLSPGVRNTFSTFIGTLIYTIISTYL